MKTSAWAVWLAAALSPLCAAAAPVGGHAVVAHHALGGSGGWDYLTFDVAGDRLFIARDNRVMVVAAGSGKLLGEIPGMQHAHGVALLPGRQRAYVSNGRGNDVSVVDLRTLKVIDRIPVNGKNPDAIIFDSASGDVLAMNGDSNSISVLDPQSNKELGTIALTGNPEFAASDGRGNVYVNLEDKGELAHVDIRTRKVLDTWPLAPCEGPTGLALDAAHARLFSVCANGWMIVTDAHDGHQVARLPIGKHPDAVAWDAQRHDVLSSSGEGVLNVIHQDDADHYSVQQSVPTLKSARTLALDPASHRVFLVGAESPRGAPVKGFQLLTVDGWW